jgi:hypothetical protein
VNDNKDSPSFAEIWTAANHTRGLVVSGYIRYIALAITVLAKRPAPERRANLISALTRTDNGKTLLASRRINDLLWKRVSSRAF